MKVALIQMNSVSDKSANLKNAERLMLHALEAEQPDWFLLPEHFDWAGGNSSDKLREAEGSTGGPAYTMAQRFAMQHKVWVHAGSFMEKVDDENRIYNCSVVFNRQGQEVARYRKIHLFDITAPDGMPYRESATVKPGSDIVTYDCEGWRFGATICYDLRFPELFQALFKAGAQVMVIPAAFTLQTGKDHWEVLCRARAIETQSYVLASGQCGHFMGDGIQRFTYGHSLCADPWGHVVAKASDGEGYITARLDKTLSERVRAQIPLLSHKVIVNDAVQRS